MGPLRQTTGDTAADWVVVAVAGHPALVRHGRQADMANCLQLLKWPSNCRVAPYWGYASCNRHYAAGFAQTACKVMQL